MNIEPVYGKLPEFYTNRIEKQAGYAAIEDPETTTVIGMILTAVMSAAGFFLLPWPILVRAGIGIPVTLIAAPAGPYMYFSLAAEKRKNKMDRILPDALNLVSANMRSGHTIEKAFLLSARDEFGPLAEEMRQTAMDMYGGKPVNEALKNMEERVKSELFQETIKLLVDGVESGGNTAELLRSSADDIRSSLEIRDEIKSNIRMYMVFIIIAAVLGAPVLFSISFYMSKTTTQMWNQSGIDADQLGEATSRLDTGFDMQFQPPQVDIDFFFQFAIMAIVMTNIFSALIISEIQNGNAKQGVKYIPIFIAVSVGLFLLVRSALASSLGGV